MATPHNAAERGDFAKTVLMPGDPLRAKFIAENFLEDAKLVTGVRGMYGYTGTYRGKKVSVMGSGMGMPSIGIYSYELFTQYDVENIIRIGSAGSMQKDVHIRDVVIAQGACTDSNFAHQYHLPGTYSAISSYSLLEQAVNVAKEKNVNCHVGNILSSDLFYHADIDSDAGERWALMGVMCVEMEAYGLFATAASLGKQALAILTISDSLVSDEEDMTSEAREKSLTDMIEIALEMAP